MDDVYSVCHRSRVEHVINAFAKAAQEVGMELHTGKIQIHGGRKDDLPEELRQWWVESMTILGNQAERTDMHPPRLGDGSTATSAAFKELTDRVNQQIDVLIELTHHGLTFHTAQAITRLIAVTKPQHLMRSALIPVEQRKAFDEVTMNIWTQRIFAGSPAADDPLVHEQLRLPIRMGGFSTGSVLDRAPAAFVIGTVQSMTEIHQAAQTTGAEALRRVHPVLVQDLDRATKELQDATGLKSVEGWKVDRPMVLKGKQKEWTTKMAEKRRDALIRAAARRQQVAIHASAGHAGKFLHPPEKEDLHFRVATLRRCGHRCHRKDKTCRNI